MYTYTSIHDSTNVQLPWKQKLRRKRFWQRVHALNKNCDLFREEERTKDIRLITSLLLPSSAFRLSVSLVKGEDDQLSA